VSRKTFGRFSDLIDQECFSSNSARSGLAAELRLQIAGLQVRAKEVAMLEELTNIPTDTLIDMLYVISAAGSRHRYN
jgi:hypothetical protein